MDRGRRARLRFDVVRDTWTVIHSVDREGTARSRGRRAAAVPPPNMLTQATVPMTVLVQDPLAGDRAGPVTVALPVPAERLQRGPRGHRFHVVDVALGRLEARRPVILHDPPDPWTYVDRWAEKPTDRLAGDRAFRAQNVYAVAAHTLALFEQHLGRPVPWHWGSPQLFLVPEALTRPVACYSREHRAVLFGRKTALGDAPSVHASLSFDVIAHEVSHAVLDGLRPRYTDPGLSDPLAFHEALADLVAMLSVFTVPGAARDLLLLEDAAAGEDHDPARIRIPEDPEGRTRWLVKSPLHRLGEQLGAARGRQGEEPPALRWSVVLEPGEAWKADHQPHRRAEVLVAAFLQTLVTMWAGRLDQLRADQDGLDVDRVAEEGVKSARHLLAMLLRALDYLPPVDLTFADVVDAVLTADARLAPDDEYGYRTALADSFARFGIVPPPHRMVDEDGVAALTDEEAAAERRRRGSRRGGREANLGRDPDRGARGTRYEHLNLAALRTSAEEVFQFIWNNPEPLKIDVRFATRVERVLGSTRVGPDGLVVTEILADYTQTLRTTVGALPPGIRVPDGMPPEDEVELWGGGVLVFDQFGRFRLHQRQPLLDVDRQSERLAQLFRSGGRGPGGVWGAAGGEDDARRLSLLHPAADEPAPGKTADPEPLTRAREVLAGPRGVGAAADLLRHLAERPPTSC